MTDDNMPDAGNSGNLLTVAAAAESAPVAYKGVPVMTTEALATALGSTSKNLSDNYRNNKDRFADGDHVFRVAGGELKGLKTDPKFSGLLGPNANAVMLWTERGAFRHAKCLNTPEAWAAYENLETTYFAAKAGKLFPAPVAVAKVAPIFRDRMACAKLIGLSGSQQIIAASRATEKATGVNVLHDLGAGKLLEDGGETHHTVSVIAERMGVKSAIAMNKLLEKYGYQTNHPDEDPRWQPTTKGMAHAELVTADPAHGKGKAHQYWEWRLSVIDAITAEITAGGEA